MIESPTVFVLGAGAHCSYGFPSGEQLIAEIVAMVRQREADFLPLANHHAARLEEVQPARAKALAEALANAGQSSIDAFLNANQHQLGFQPIGKAAIAQVLLDYERHESKRRPDPKDDWLQYLFHVLLVGVDSTSKLTTLNNISFITFNYDTFLESWLHARIKHSFGVDDDSALRVLRQIPIHHVYGTLGEFPSTNTGDRYAWIHASMGIRTIFDTNHDSTAVEAAKELLANAHVICLLGFGYHRENIDLLDLSTHARSCKGVVASSRYGITDTEWDRLMRSFEGVNVHPSASNQKCLDALRNLPIF